MAGRPRTPIGTWGDIHTKQLPTRRWEARTRIRDHDGKLRLVGARGKSESAAKTALRTKLTTRTTTTADHDGLHPTTTITTLCDHWATRKKNLRPQTKDRYTNLIATTIRPAIGNLTLTEATPGRLSHFLETIPTGSRNIARTILTQAFALAVSHDALATNPIAQLPKESPKAPEDIRVLTPEELLDLRRGVTAWQAGHLNEEGATIDAPDPRTIGRSPDLLRFVDILLATGCRPGEIAALRWCDVNLGADLPTVTVAATMIAVAGEGLVRQEQTKGGKDRVLALPPYAVQVLAEMRQEQHTPIGTAPVFPTRDGGHKHPANIRREWRRAREAAGRGDPDKYGWVEFRSMRRTVATVIDRASSDSDAAAQLGNGLGVARRHYIAARAAEAPDLTAVLEAFAG